jgi:endonuclease/exonuclease/phosphatase family metal-dependent hydrolase
VLQPGILVLAKAARPASLECTFRIDWILTRGPWECDANDVVAFSRENQFPSDHHPIAAQGPHFTVK